MESLKVVSRGDDWMQAWERGIKSGTGSAPCYNGAINTPSTYCSYVNSSRKGAKAQRITLAFLASLREPFIHRGALRSWGTPGKIDRRPTTGDTSTALSASSAKDFHYFVVVG